MVSVARNYQIFKGISSAVPTESAGLLTCEAAIICVRLPAFGLHNRVPKLPYICNHFLCYPRGFHPFVKHLWVTCHTGIVV
jgi:hypothetical protein